METETLISDSSGKLLYKIISGAFMVGAKNFKDSGITNSEKVEVPKRDPDAVLEMPTSEYQAQVYRLSGDYNPLHVDPGFAQMSGFKAPILHGLCSFGISCRAVVKQFCDNNPKNFKAIKARFAKPVMPGDTLVVKMWKDGDKVVFTSSIKESGDVVINNAYVLLEPQAKM